MATNPESEPQVGNLDTQEQRIEAVRLLREYNEEAQKIIRLNSELNQQGKALTESETVEIKKDIAECEKRREKLRGRMEQEYHAQTPRQLDISLKQRGIDFIDSQYDYLAGLPQQKQNQFQGANQQGVQNEGRSTSLEKDMAAMERLQESMQLLKKARDEADSAKRSYELAQEEYQKAFEAVMRVNYELLESNRLLRERIGEDLPLQQNDTILDQRVIKGFGTASVNEARRMVEESWRDYQQDVQQEPVEGIQGQSQEPRDFSESYPQAEQSPQQPKERQHQGESKSDGLLGLYQDKEPPHYMAARARAESRGKSGGLLELYEDKQPLHHEAGRGRAENRGLNFNKKSGLTPGD